MTFIPDTAILLQFALATIIITLTPGPDMTLFVGRALSAGKAAGFACFAGATTGILIHTSLVALGLSALLIAAPTAFWALKIAGAGYLIWLAFQALRHGSAFSPNAVKGPERTLFNHWATGLGINLLNPKIIIFFMTFLPQFITPGDPHASGKLFFLGVLFILIAIPMTIPMILAADSFSGALKRNPKVTQAIDYLFAGVFSAFAVKILLTEAK
jgi:threonine/homoserine/homoserine lactone efflux protein